jgi:2-iminobutanoate/2-iminopropanoate deaminase
MQHIHTAQAPEAIGPYSQATVAQGFVFVSGQIPLHPETNTLMHFDGDIAKQTELVLSNLHAILAAAGCAPKHVVKTTVFLTNIQDAAAVNAVYANFFGDHAPARAVCAVTALPKGANIEIEAIACCPT